MKKHKLWYRNRGLEKMEARFGNNSIQNLIKKNLELKDLVRVLEIGFGEGRCLLELRELFPDKKLELYGINNIKKGNMFKRKDFLNNAKHFGINLKKQNLLPKPYFYDAGEELKFESNYLDLVISQVAVHYVGNKAKLLEEIWRVLKPGGKAFLHIDNKPKEDYPDFMKYHQETPRFMIYDKKNKVVPLSRYLNLFRKKGYGIRLVKPKRDLNQRLVLITKNNNKPLNLRLKYDHNSTINLTSLKTADEHKNKSSAWWGKRSVFYIK